MTTTTAAPTRSRNHGLRNHRLHTVLGTAVAAAVAWTVLREVGGVDLAVASPAGPSTVGLPATVATALVVGLAAWGLLAALPRWTRAPRRTWLTIAGIGFALSLTGPITSAVDLPAAGGLITLHVVVAAGLVTGLTRRC
jgi:uncharacterized protein DUF6069